MWIFASKVFVPTQFFWKVSSLKLEKQTCLPQIEVQMLHRQDDIKLPLACREHFGFGLALTIAARAEMTLYLQLNQPANRKKTQRDT